MAAAIKVQDLEVELGGQRILKRLAFEAPQGKIIGLLGPSGAGKTTLIRTIVGRQKITKGSVEIFDLAAGDKQLRVDIGYMTQSPAVYPDLSVRENVRYFAAMRNLPKSAADEAITQVELSGQSKQLFATLSGGQKSRVSLAIALLGQPKLLVLDEPTVGVDPVLRRQLWQLFAGLAARGTTLIISSHVMDEAEHCEELLLIRDGKLLASGSPRELRERTASKTVEDSFLKLVEPKR
ncbi:MAG TPA: ABC transporter ATP-binding protein [Candidatus Saccharimonadales bacterium]|nr:ABC transporter ATP-binding protein [Candidatus Saccharimonadales bacterium]